MFDITHHLNTKCPFTHKYVTKLLSFPFKDREHATQSLKQYITDSSLSLVLDRLRYTPFNYAVIPLDKPFTFSSKEENLKNLEKQKKEIKKENLNIFKSREDDISDSDSFFENYFINTSSIKIDTFDLWSFGHCILKDTSLTLLPNTRYGLVGRNGVGKSTFLFALKNRQISFKKMKVHLVKQEHYGGNLTVLETVLNTRISQNLSLCSNYKEIEKNLEILAAENKFENKKIQIEYLIKLFQGFEFPPEFIFSKTNTLSGGWISKTHLVRGLYAKPDILLLDEPTNMLDLFSLLFLQMVLVTLECTVIVVSHDMNFLECCDSIIHMESNSLNFYKGNFSCFVEQKNLKNEENIRNYNKQVKDREHLQAFVDRFRYNAKRASQAQSRLKILNKMEILQVPVSVSKMKYKFLSEIETDGFKEMMRLKGVSVGYANRENRENNKDFKNNENENKDFKNSEIRNNKDRYNEDKNQGTNRENQIKTVLTDLDISINNKSRVVIVGSNGCGKSTLLKVICNKNEDVLRVWGGNVTYGSGTKVCLFSQCHVDNLPYDVPVLNFFMNMGYTQDTVRSELCNFGLVCENQLIGSLSGGQKSKVVFCLLSLSKPDLLVLDEPTNHLDMESIEALSLALQDYKGGIVCVSHDIWFVEKVFKEVWIVENSKLRVYEGDIKQYKDSVIRNIKNKKW
ncbi:ABC transporter [Hamiltosporidium tvaerminnensis]|uniref:ABC transporter n=1 Tax=Hamiltosporidium tvaerminnensis TaxID=1176355 RepID=A0A4Q9LT86_9MICR|nr:ABC transporter [Hamiltosporidium tvaerminnensis]